MAEVGTKLCCARRPVWALPEGTPLPHRWGCRGPPRPGCSQVRPLGSSTDSGSPRWPGVCPAPGWPAKGVPAGIQLPADDRVPFTAVP